MLYRISIILLITCFSCNPKKQSQAMQDKQEKNKVSEKTSHDLSMYPEANNETDRHIISLPKLENEANNKIELYIGKDMEVDCNQHTFTGDLIKKNVEGWGYSYFNFESDGTVMSTLMGCPDDSKHHAFVYYKSELINYNSRLPIVVFTNKNYKVKYKIWSSETELHE